MSRYTKDNCINIENSYGEICVSCGWCDVKVGDPVNYHSWIDEETGDKSEPITTLITHLPYMSSGGDMVCFVEAVKGYVSMRNIDIINQNRIQGHND